ncbi:chemotaxis protein CheB [Leptolyngbya sp. AN02str]|uniref:chemotaxis protein CheB n=1 Tax=Leptolyngbya sp. AN02str TaxID=3423363 RepID=UPI003D312FD8
MSFQDPTNDVLLVVGIGASAGGLGAFSELLRHLPADTGMAFVLVQHLAPEQESLLGDLLARTTPMPVEVATMGAEVQPNHVYVIPPNTQMTIEQGQLQLAVCDQTQGRVKTIDAFFQSLAADQKNKAIAIVLSGSNNDGAVGIQSIREEGGIVFAQEHSSAEFANMPAAAIATGQVDFILSPAAIAEELVKISRHPYLRKSPPAEGGETSSLDIREDELVTVFRLLQRQTGVDFTNYKLNTFQRRLQRRLALHKCLDLSEYTQYLQEHPAEIQALYNDVLITVTSFFRDAEVFHVIQDQLLPTLLHQPSAASTIRIWIAGCATGEEAYSLAICLLESLHSLLLNPTIQIFGTDISDEAIETARIGFYRESQMENVSAERRSRFFNEVTGGYQIKKSVRELCIFARQDLSTDPPFSDIDLLSCRNVLIYFKPPLQRRVLSFFHYSLKPSGFLILGNSESLGDTSDLFEPFDAQAKVYTRQAVPSRLNFDFTPSYYAKQPESEQRQIFSAALIRTNLQQWADQVVLSRYGPAGVLVNEQLEILQFRGDTNPYLRIPAGEPSYNVLKMVRPSLLTDLRIAIETVKQQGIAIKRQGLIFQELLAGSLSLEVIPFRVSTSQERCYLILFEREGFEEPTLEQDPDASMVEDQANIDPEMFRLRQELTMSRQELLDTQTLLQLTVEEKESTNQQLIAANEEILSSNEELKSTNEELQTAKEEIQSANEELKTTNEELQKRNIEVRRASDDLMNLINHVNIPILMLSDDLRIRRFTPAAQDVFNLIPSDVGRPIRDLRFGMTGTNLEELVVEVIEALNPIEQEVQNQRGHWYSLRIRPYRTVDNEIRGAVVALMDIDHLKQTEQNLRQIQEQLETELVAINQVQDLSVQLFASLDLDRALNEVLDAAIALHQTEMGTVQLYDLQRGVLTVAAHRGFGSEFLDYLQAMAVNSNSSCYRAVQQRQRMMIEDVQIEPEYEPHRSIAATAGVRALQSTPLINRRGEILGVLSTYFQEPHRPSERELRMLDLYARQASEFIDLIRVEREQQMLVEHARAAQAANASKDEFLAVLSHELRTPLTSILSWIQLMERGLLDEVTQQQAIAAIRESTATQTKLIEELLDVSRIVQDRFQVALQPSDLTTLLQQAIAQLQPQMQAQGLQLETDLQACPEQISVDPTRISQVFSNLLVNAIKFTPRDGRIIVRLLNGPNQVQVQVQDTGKGISRDLLPHVFERFRQSDASNTRREGGLGLGLFLVQSIMTAHKGTVEAHSPGEGQGSTFTVTFPKDHTISVPIAAPAVPISKISLDGVKVLLVEDDEMSSIAISFALQQFGATVTKASSVTDALEQLRQELPNLIVSDIGLPNINGYDLMRRVRALSPEAGGLIPAIALSGYADQETINTALEVGFQVHLSKPADIDRLITHIFNLVQT